MSGVANHFGLVDEGGDKGVEKFWKASLGLWLEKIPWLVHTTIPIESSKNAALSPKPQN